jgi:hypothetical protein
VLLYSFIATTRERGKEPEKDRKNLQKRKLFHLVFKMMIREKMMMPKIFAHDNETQEQEMTV